MSSFFSINLRVRQYNRTFKISYALFQQPPFKWFHSFEQSIKCFFPSFAFRPNLYFQIDLALITIFLSHNSFMKFYDSTLNSIVLRMQLYFFQLTNI